ncbi:hypothetical protein [Okeania sp. KiyG1]|uniref:hypothetical protein n=1 Tax=Okeania sp. KiyG1 TaxID=2720165 RepID=UPI0019241A65|nr:hypothetical protein [Okeania sp. KiyG1]GGA09108.1 hypothetical protein CYANOKiyG1_21940 [Okeania sp. KiyG1]
MSKIEVYPAEMVFITPKLVLHSAPFTSGEVKDAFNIEASGMGELTGLAYDVPAHTSGTIKATLQISAMSSKDVEDLNQMALAFLKASERKKVEETAKTSVQGNLSLFGSIFGGGASASYSKTRHNMESAGLSEEQISQLMEAFLAKAQQMSSVSIDFYVNNEPNDYSVSGNLYLYTLSGQIQTGKGSHQYRMLADKASAGAPPPPPNGSAQSTGEILPLQ